MNDDYIPLEIIKCSWGFGLTIPEVRGLGLEKKAMYCSEELSRGWVGVGSLGTRSEIAAELILIGGTEQKKKYLSKISNGEIFLQQFSEPDMGSDLAHLKTEMQKVINILLMK